MKRAPWPSLFLIATAALSLAACRTGPVPPAPTPTPASTPTLLLPTATTVPTPLPQGPCANPLLPLLPGNQWTYAASGTASPASIELSVIEVNGAQASVRILDVNSGSASEVVVHCDRGAITDFPLVFFNMLSSNVLSGVVNTQYLYGEYAPSYDMLVTNQWSGLWNLVELTENGEKIILPGMTDDIYSMVNMEMIVNVKAGGVRSPLAVPAGTYPQALEVTQEMKLPVTRLGPQGSEKGLFTLTFTQWYEPFVGLLKMQAGSASLSFPSDASLPVPVQAMLELTRFQPGR